MWTKFMNMHSGGGLKEEWQYIYIEAPEDEAKIIFYNRFGHNPERVTCTCCGRDYSISESETLEQATAYERGCHWDKQLKQYVDKPSSGRYSSNKYKTLEEYLEYDGVLFIYDNEIKEEERQSNVPQEGYVWV